MRRQKVKQYYFLAIVFTIAIFHNGNVMRVGKAFEQPSPLIGDALIPPDLPPKHNSSITPGYFETSEYLIGSVAVGIIFLESNGTIDPQTENWTSTEESQVVSKIQDALNWWSNQNPSANVSFTWTINYRVPTSYEPINRRGGPLLPPNLGKEKLWIQDAMNYLGYPGTDYFAQVRDYVNALRNSTGTNWAFAMFIVDSSNDDDGKFADGQKFAYAYLGGPFLVMTYDNDGWGIDNMDRVAAHEIGHIFYATDEYDGATEYSGYLNVSDVEGSGALMDTGDWWLSTGTKGQIGWRDTDNDGIQDIVDTFPDTSLNPYFPDPIGNATLDYTGSVTEVPYPNSNPHGTGMNVTINIITSVQFRIDYGAWINANATDGIFDETVEDLTFTTSSLSSGTHTIETRGINSVGNAETSYSSDTVTIKDSNPPTTIHDYDGLWRTADFNINLTATDDFSGVAETYYKINDGSTQNVSINGQPIITTEDANNSLEYWSLDNADNEELPHKTLTGIKLDKTAPTGSITINNRDAYTNSTSVTLTLNATDETSGVYQVRFCNDSLWDTEPWETPSPTKAWTLPIGDGTKTVYYQVGDLAGLASNTYSDTIVLDTDPPKILGISPENGTEIKSSTIKATWSGTDETSGIYHYEIRLNNGSWINTGTNTTYTFTGTRDGNHVLDIKTVDRANNSRQVRIRFSVNTSLIGRSGWTDDVIVFGTLGFLIAGALLFFLLRKK